MPVTTSSREPVGDVQKNFCGIGDPLDGSNHLV